MTSMHRSAKLYRYFHLSLLTTAGQQMHSGEVLLCSPKKGQTIPWVAYGESPLVTQMSLAAFCFLFLLTSQVKTQNSSRVEIARV